MAVKIDPPINLHGIGTINRAVFMSWRNTVWVNEGDYHPPTVESHKCSYCGRRQQLGDGACIGCGAPL